MWFLIGVAELEQYLDRGKDMVLVDVRDRNSYEKGHIQGAINIPSDELPDRMQELPKEKLIVLYCYRGPHSMLAARALSRAGYRVADVYGGIMAYRGKYMV